MCKEDMNEEIVEQETTEEVTAQVDETVEETAEIAEQAEETAEVAETDEDPEEIAEDAAVEEDAEEPKNNAFLTAFIATCVVCVLLMVLEFVILNAKHNKYVESLNHYNLNKDGYATTIERAAEQEGITLEEYKEENSYPAELPGDTVLAIAETYVPAMEMLKKNGVVTDDASFDEYIKKIVDMYEVDAAEISKDMPYGAFAKIMDEAQNNAKLFKLMNSDEQQFEQAKQMYQQMFGIEITKDMKYSEFMKLVRDAQKKQEEEAAKATPAPAEGEAAPAEGEAAPAEGEAAPAEGEAAPAEAAPAQ